MEMTSPSLRTRFREGMPCTISWLIDVQSVPGKPYSPLNAGVAPGWLRMNSSAIASRSSVEMPARTSRRSMRTVAARILPPSAISSISRRLFSWITCVSCERSFLEGAEGALRDVLNFAYGVDRGYLRAVLLVPVQHGRRLLLVDVEAVADRLRLVVLAAHQLAAALLAGRTRLAPRVWRLTLLAHRAAGQATYDLVVVDVEHEHGVHLLAELLHR